MSNWNDKVRKARDRRIKEVLNIIHGKCESNSNFIGEIEDKTRINTQNYNKGIIKKNMKFNNLVLNKVHKVKLENLIKLNNNTNNIHNRDLNYREIHFKNSKEKMVNKYQMNSNINNIIFKKKNKNEERKTIIYRLRENIFKELKLQNQKRFLSINNILKIKKITEPINTSIIPKPKIFSLKKKIQLPKIDKTNIKSCLNKKIIYSSQNTINDYNIDSKNSFDIESNDEDKIPEDKYVTS